VAFLPKLLPVA